MKQNATFLTELVMTIPNLWKYVRFFNMKIIVYHSLMSVVCSCLIHVLHMATLIHIVRSVRAATFNDYIHMHLVPYLKSQ